MKIATLVEPQKIVFDEVDKPTPADHEVMIKVSYLGICGSDIHAYFGKHPFISCPITMGHEFSGKVEAVGKKVTGIEIGELITAMPQVCCGECEPCKSGRYNICNTLEVIGCQTPGAACDYFTIDAGRAKKIPQGITSDIATTVEPVAVGVHAVQRGASVKGKHVVVLGAGTIGNVTAQAALAKGAKRVLITDLSAYRLKVARRCGIANTANTGEVPLESAIHETFREEGADIFFECVGIGATVNQAIELSKKGNDIIVVGVFGQKPDVNMALVQDKELRLIGSLMYTEKDYDDTIEYLQNGKINTRPLISKVFSFDEYAEAFHYIEENADQSLKILVKLED